MTNGRGWAYAGLVFGSVVSVGGNVTDNVVHHRPSVSGLVWPVALFIGVEIVVRFQSDRKAWKWTRALGMMPVTTVAALVSYIHLSSLLSHWGEDRTTVAVGPIVIDGLMTVATGALVLSPVLSRRDNKPDTKSDTKEDTKEDTKPDTNQDTKPDTNQDTKTDNKPDTKPDTKSRTRRRTWDTDLADKLLSEGMGLDEVATRVGVDPKTISRYLRSKS